MSGQEFLSCQRKGFHRGIVLPAADQPESDGERRDNGGGKRSDSIRNTVGQSKEAMPVYTKGEVENGAFFVKGTIGLCVIGAMYTLLERLGVFDKPSRNKQDNKKKADV